jgi:hypothetical protein
MRLRPGDPVLVRSIYRSQVRWTFPHTFVGNEDGVVALLLRPGTRGKWLRRDPGGRYLARWIGDDPPDDHVWERNRILWLARPGAAHSLGLFWDEATDEFRGWYVQLQDPLRRSRLGFDTMDHALDVWIGPDGSWTWKDEDDLSEAEALGVFTPQEAAEVRAEGDRVLAARPWPTGWEDWRPDPRWQLPELPPGWDAVD